MTRYRLSPAAERDLEEILDYTVQQWGLGQALRYMEKLEPAFEVLVVSPVAGLDSREVRAGYRRLRLMRCSSAVREALNWLNLASAGVKCHPFPLSLQAVRMFTVQSGRRTLV